MHTRSRNVHFASQVFEGGDGRCELHFERLYCPVYTDCSALRPESKATARAGWAAYNGEGSALNVKQPLMGKIHLSYRAELRAALHVVRTAAANVIIIADCKAVALQLQKISEGESLPPRIADRDLWEKIVFLAKGRKGKH